MADRYRNQVFLALPVDDIALSQRADFVVREHPELALGNTSKGSSEPFCRVISFGDLANPDALDEVASELPQAVSDWLALALAHKTRNGNVRSSINFGILLC
jgi:hypothetical protein